MIALTVAVRAGTGGGRGRIAGCEARAHRADLIDGGAISVSGFSWKG